MKILWSDGVIFMRGGSLVDAENPCGCCGEVVARRCDGSWPPKRVSGPVDGVVFRDSDGHCYYLTPDVDAFGLLEEASPAEWFAECWDCIGCDEPGECIPWGGWGRYTVALVQEGVSETPAGDCFRHDGGRPCVDTWVRVGSFSATQTTCFDQCGFVIRAIEVTRVAGGTGTTRRRSSFRGIGTPGICDLIDESNEGTVPAAAQGAPILAYAVGEFQSQIVPRAADGWTGAGFIGCRTSHFSASISRIGGTPSCPVSETGRYTEVRTVDAACDGFDTDASPPNLLAVGCGHGGSTPYPVEMLFDAEAADALFDARIYIGVADGLAYRLTAASTLDPVTQGLNRTNQFCTAPAVTLRRCGDTGPAFVNLPQWDEEVEIGDWARLSIGGLELCYEVVALIEGLDLNLDGYAVIDSGPGGCSGCGGDPPALVRLPVCNIGSRFVFAPEDEYDALLASGALDPEGVVIVGTMPSGTRVCVSNRADARGVGFVPELAWPATIQQIAALTGTDQWRASCSECVNIVEPPGPVEPPGDPQIMVGDNSAEIERFLARDPVRRCRGCGQ